MPEDTLRTRNLNYIMDRYCPLYGLIRSDYDRSHHLRYLRGSKRTAMNLAIDRHNDLVAEQMDAFKVRMAPHVDALDSALQAASKRYASDMQAAEARYVRAMRKAINPLLTKDERKRYAIRGRYWNNNVTNVLDDIWRVTISPLMKKLHAFRDSMDPHLQPPKRSKRPATAPEKSKALKSKAVAKLVESYTNTLQEDR